MSTTTTTLPQTRRCPKCGYQSNDALAECPACGVVVAKFVEADERPDDAVAHVTAGSPLGVLDSAERLMVKQEVERLEMWTGFETANQYTVKEGGGRVLFDAHEESGNAEQLLGRLFLKSARPFTIHLVSLSGDAVLKAVRPFRLLFSEVTVQDVHGHDLGTVRRRFDVLNRRYAVETASGDSTYEIVGPLFRPWTFKIVRGEQECGIITKKWGGLRREMVTDADSFGIEFPQGISRELKAVFLGAVFLIDFAHFEDND